MHTMHRKAASLHHHRKQSKSACPPLSSSLPPLPSNPCSSSTRSPCPPSSSTRCSSQQSALHSSRSRRRAVPCVQTFALPDLRQADRPARLAIFVSGGGSNMKALHAAILDGRLNAEISAVVSDKPGCGAVQYAEAHRIKTLTFPIPKNGAFPGLTSSQIVEELKQNLGVEFVLLAGYLKLIPSELVSAFPKAMLNIHPGLLPGFGGKGMYGENVHKAVIASGARFSGPTVHFVDEGFDTGPILAQAVVPVKPTDTPKTLAARVLVQEHAIFPHAVSALVDGRVSWREDGVPILWSDS